MLLGSVPRKIHKENKEVGQEKKGDQKRVTPSRRLGDEVEYISELSNEQKVESFYIPMPAPGLVHVEEA